MPAVLAKGTYRQHVAGQIHRPALMPKMETGLCTLICKA